MEGRDCSSIIVENISIRLQVRDKTNEEKARWTESERNPTEDEKEEYENQVKHQCHTGASYISQNASRINVRYSSLDP
jgi:HSP90 family molecular chaperone